MPRLFCFITGVLVLFIVENTYALPPKIQVKKAPLALHIDSGSKISIHRFNGGALNHYAKQKEFNYDDVPAENLSLWQRFWRWVWHIISSIFDQMRENRSTWFLFKIALFVIAAAALAFIAFKIAGIDIINVLKGNSKKIEVPYGESLENIHDINFDSEIEKEISNRNYRLAVRLLYLRCLKQLSDAQLIHWKIEKTNASYVNELAGSEHRQTFSLLTTQFEYIWYGDFPIDGQSFQNINSLFIDFKKELL